MLEESLPLFQKAQLISTNADLSASTDDLWRVHDLFTKGGQNGDSVVGPSLLDLKIEIAHRIHQNCHFCERRCQTDRNKKPGFCGVVESKYSSEFLHYGEERELVPSHTIFLPAARSNVSSVKIGILRAVQKQVKSATRTCLHGECMRARWQAHVT
ncbi:MAG: hypothetical protein ACXV5H_09910 [Halobacteriota archaeon]